jgi:putative ABC transport system permease protein
MKLRYTIQTAARGLQTSRSRSALTILGIVIGITAIIMVVSLGSAAQNLILGQIDGFGAELITINPGQRPSGPADITGTLFADTIGRREVAAIQKIPGVKAVHPAVFVPEKIGYQDKLYKPSLFGWTGDALRDIMQASIGEGRYVTQEDIDTRAKVILIGDDIKKELFGDEPALRKKIKIKNHSFRVIGVLAKDSGSVFFSPGEIALIPYSTAQDVLLGFDHFQEVHIRAESPEIVKRVAANIERTMREMHDIEEGDDDDFFVTTQEETVGIISTVTTSLTIFLSAIAAISLVVGGVGIMNIMLVSVTERTKEIGLRKSIGATDKDIMTQFLLEAVFLTVVGGVIGMLLGGLLAWLAAVGINHFTDLDWMFIFPVSAAFLGLGVSAAVGLTFGIYPARQAAKKSPIEALTYE